MNLDDNILEEGITQVILAVDVGSSSIRCTAYRVRAATGSSPTKPGGSSQQADKVEPVSEDSYAVRKIRTVEPNTGKIMLTTEDGTNLLDEIDGIIDECLEKLRNSLEEFHVLGLGFATFCMNLIALDEYGNPVGKEATLSYACATPSVAEECRWLKRHLGADREKDLYQRTGAPLHSSYALPQLRQLYSNNNSFTPLIHKIVIWQTLCSTCLTRWRATPFSHVSFSEASWTGLFNFRTCEWDKEAASLLPEECKNHMPPLSDYSDDFMPSGGVRSDMLTENGMERNPYWDRWPELRGCDQPNGAPRCRLFLGLGDGACANIGSKCCSSQKIAVTIGTSAAARVCVPMRGIGEHFRVPEGLFCYRLDRSHVIVGGALTDGGSVVEWARGLLNLRDDSDFADCITEVEQLLNQDYNECTQGNVASSAVSLVPFLSGERSTGYRDGASFCMSGLTRTSTSASFMKACLEGVILRIGAILRLLREGVEAGKRQPRIVASGSALENNDLWRQMLADCSGLQVQLDTSIRESTSVGVATMVATALAMERDMSTDSTNYLTNDTASPNSRYSCPRLPITESYWLVALEDQESLIDAVSSLW